MRPWEVLFRSSGHWRARKQGTRRGGEVSDVVWGAVTPFRSVFAGSGTILEELEGSSPESDGGIEKSCGTDGSGVDGAGLHEIKCG